MKLFFALALALSVTANAQPTTEIVSRPAPLVLTPASIAPPTFDGRCFVDVAAAVKSAGDLAEARAERDSLKESHIDGRKVAAIAISVGLAALAAGVAAGYGIHEATRSR